MSKDPSLHQLLERTLGARTDTSGQGACLDAETLAAWADGSLTAAQRTAAEAHVADCDRCLAVVAAIAQTSPPPSTSTTAQRPAWLTVRWLAPLTAAALAITTWAFVQGPFSPQRPVAPPTPQVVDSVTPVQPVTPAERAASASNRADALAKKADAPRASAVLKDQAERRRSADAAAKPSAAPATESPAPPAAPTEAIDQQFRSMARAEQGPRLIVSPDPDVRWRLSGPSVERSADGGRTWQRQPTSTSLELLAGSSPAPSVCWIVGRSGLVLLSTDGRTWRRLDFPGPAVDLVAVTAQDGEIATVTASDGKTYRTVDAGRTWILQENPAPSF
ncbi:hypothetical protein BH24ACI5_BH24ACI5_21990 [soil metagenome]